MGIDLKQDQKVLVLGDFQTGKTTFLKWMRSQMQRSMTFDPTWAFPNGKHTIAEAVADFKSTGHGVFQPQPYEMEAQFDTWCYAVMEEDNLMSFIDEPALVMSAMGSIPPGFSALYRLGHKRGIGVTLATHKYHGDIPSLTRIKHHMFCFRMSVDNDLRAVAGEVGIPASQYISRQQDYYFYYKGTGAGNTAQAYAPLPMSGLKTPTEHVPSGGQQSPQLN